MKKSKDTVKYKNTFSEEFKEISVHKTMTRNSGPSVEFIESQLYESEISVSEEKKNDLMELCAKGLIPNEYTTYYQNLTAVNGLKEYTPDIEEYVSDGEN